MTCGARDENGDICGETYTCVACRAANRAESILQQLLAASTALVKALEPRFMRTGCSEAEEKAMKAVRAAIARADGQ